MCKPGFRQFDQNVELRYSRPIILDTVNGAETRRHPVLDLNLVIDQESSKNITMAYKIKAYELEFPLAQPTSKLFGVKLRFPGEKFASFPTTVELQTLPAICLGVENLQVHPIRIPMDKVPKSIKKRFPNSVVLKSELTGKLLLAGNVGESSSYISNLICISNLFTFPELRLPRSKEPQRSTAPSPKARSELRPCRAETRAEWDRQRPGDIKGLREFLELTKPPRGSRSVFFADPLCTFYSIPPNNKGRPAPDNGWGGHQVRDKEPSENTLHLLACISEELGNDLPELSELETGSAQGSENKGNIAASPWAGLEGSLDNVRPFPDDVKNLRPEVLQAKRAGTKIVRPVHDCTDSEPCVMRKVFSQSDSESYKANEFLYRLYLADLREFLQPPGKSIDLQGGRVGCSQCDPRHAILTSSSVANNSLLLNQLKWQPWVQGQPGGRFVINRLYRAKMELFPSCENSVRADTQNLVVKLGNRPNTSKECSYRLQKDFLNEHCSFLTTSEKKQAQRGYITFGKMKIRLVYIPQHCIYNALSGSSPCRVVNVPNRKYRLDDGSFSTYNDMIRSYSMSMNSIEKLQLRQCLSVEVLGGDVSDAFKSCENSYPTSLRCLTFALRQADGLPTYTQSGSLKLEALRWNRATYGISDLPVVFATALAQCVSVYRKHGKGRFPEWLLKEIENCLKGLSYCDDLQLSSLPEIAITFAATKNIFPPERKGPLTVEYCKKYDTFLEQASDIYLTEVSTAMMEVLAECNFYLKSIDARKPAMRKALNSPGVLRKRESGKLPDIERPEAALVHQEAGKKSKNLHFITEGASPDSSRGHPVEQSPVFLTQLSRNFHENGTITLKTKHLSLDSTHKNPLEFIYNYEQFLEHLTVRKITLNKRHLFSLSGQFYDNLGWTLSLAKTCIKVACHQLHCGPDPPDAGDWDSPVPVKVRDTVLLAVRCFYVAVNRSLVRSSIYHYPGTGHILVSESDAGACCHSSIHFLISWTRISNIYRARVQLLTSKPFVNQVSMKSVPLLELLAFLKSTVETIQLLEWLDELGVQIAPCNVLLLSDSQTTLIQCRSRAALHSIRVGHMVSKIGLQLLHGQLSPFNNSYMFRQGEQIFHADILTKLPKQHSLEAIEESENRLRNYSWMETPPSSWDHISRGGVPAGDKELTNDLEINPDYLQEAVELIETFKKSHNSLFTPDQLPDSSRGHPLDRTAHLGASPLEVGPNNHEFTDLLLRKLSKGVVGSGTAIRILARCLFWIKRVLYISRLGSKQREAYKRRQKKLYNKIRDKYSPWCHKVACHPPLHKRGYKGNCHSPNHYRVSGENSCPCSPLGNTLESNPESEGGGVSASVEQDVDPVKRGVGPPLSLPTKETDKGPGVPGTNQSLLGDTPVQTTKLGCTAKPDSPSPSLIQQKLEMEMHSLVPFPWSHHCVETFEGAALQYLCCMYASQEAYTDSARLMVTDLGNGFLTCWGLGRVQRDRSSRPGAPVNCGRPLLRLVAPESVLGQAFMVSAHHYSKCHETHGTDHTRSLSFLLQKGVYFKHARKHLNNYSRNCQLCQLNRAVIGKSRHLVVRSQSGPSETLSTLSSARFPVASAVCDLAGPWAARCLGKAKCNLKIWYLILVCDLGRVYIYPLQDYSAASTLQCLVTHANKFGTFSFLASDAGAQFNPLATTLSPLQSGESLPEDLHKTWARLLHQSPEQQQQLQETNGSSFRLYCQGRHSCIGAAEKIVHLLKIYLKKCKLFRRTYQRNVGKIDLLNHQYIISKVELIANSRPLFIDGDEILTINDLSLVAQRAGPFLGSSGLTTGLPEDKKQAKAYKERLNKMQAQTNVLMESLAHYLAPLLLEQTACHLKNRDGPKAEHLAVGDIVLDKRQVQLSGCLTGSLARIQVLSECSRWAIIIRVKNSHLDDESTRLNRAIARGWKLEPKKYRSAFISVGRDTRHLFLVAKASTDEKTTQLHSFNGGERIFEFGRCLEKIRQRDFVPLCLPPRGFKSSEFKDVPPDQWVSTSLEEQFDETILPALSPNSSESEDSSGDEAPVDERETEDFAVSTPDYGDEEQVGLEDRVTRSGRVSRRPARFGV